ncbi:MAG TPA: RluA family pseudouridine synthase [Planctomycetota bacterium]|nr:RluA family pseudouridine synthase [Planctomycetota bacterium]
MTSAADTPELEFILPPEHAGKRIDVAVAACRPSMSRTYAGRLFRDGAILINGKQAKPSAKARGGELVSIDLPEPETIEARPEDIPLNIIFEDRDIVVVNKPAGMVTHPSAGHSSGSLVNALLFHCKDLSSINGSLRPGIVHRLDMDTSGVIVAAKNDAAHRSLADQFAERIVKKEYLALCRGDPPRDVFFCDGRIGRHPTRRTEMTILKGAAEGRDAYTDFQVVERFKGPLFLVRALPRTGRTHQIRVHLAKSGYPILADALYGKEATLPELDLTRQALHAAKLSFNHPATNARVTFEAPLAEDIQAALTRARA